MRRLGWETRTRRRMVKRPWLAAFLGLVGISLLLHLLTRFAGMPASGFGGLIDACVILVGVVAIMAPVQGKIDWYLAIVLGIILLGMGLACLGIETAWGVPFGRMTFTGAWHPSMGVIPLLWPGLWMLIAAGSALAARKVLHGLPAMLAAGILAALADMAIEPVMSAKLLYWQWPEASSLPGGAPLMNSVGWFLSVGVAAAVIHRWLREEHVDDAAPAIVLVVFVLSTVANGYLL
jgi:hypothetical protein